MKNYLKISSIFKKKMSLMGRVMAVFPLLHLLLILFSLVYFIKQPGLVEGLVILGAIYAFPLLSYHVHNYFFPVKDGVYDLSSRGYVPWWGLYNLQILFYAFPQFERVLLLIPGAYQQWLRLWGAKIGRNVVFTPRIDLLDRTHLNIGDKVFFGAEIGLSQHIIRPKRRRLILVVRSITIGHRVFLGAESRISPGAIIEDDVTLPYGSFVGINQKVTAKTQGELFSKLKNTRLHRSRSGP